MHFIPFLFFIYNLLSFHLAERRLGGDGGNRSCASSAASQPSHLYVPFAVAKDGLCGFDYLKKRTQTEKSVQVRLGGDEDDKSETVLSSDNVRLLALSLKLK